MVWGMPWSHQIHRKRQIYAAGTHAPYPGHRWLARAVHVVHWPSPVEPIRFYFSGFFNSWTKMPLPSVAGAALCAQRMESGRQRWEGKENHLQSEAGNLERWDHLSVIHERCSWKLLILGSQAPGAFQEDWPYFLPWWSVGFSLSSWLKWFSVLTTKRLEQNPEYFKKHIFCISGKTDSRAVFHINHKTATEAHKHVSFTLKPHTELEFTDVLTSLPYYRRWARALISPPSTRPVKAEQCVFQMHEDPQ